MMKPSTVRRPIGHLNRRGMTRRFRTVSSGGDIVLRSVPVRSWQLRSWYQANDIVGSHYEFRVLLQFTR
jgi:hypothetical protein